jgi:hypothetical protein
MPQKVIELLACAGGGIMADIEIEIFGMLPLYACCGLFGENTIDGYLKELNKL